MGSDQRGKLWALMVGMNRYRSFPPLPYARQDVEAVYDFLRRRRQLAPECGLLLTDVSPPKADRPTLPTRDVWWSWLQGICGSDQLQPEDVLWVMFSGYGVQENGEDYLMPWDGDPKNPVETGIPVRSILNLLHGARTSRILLILDISRSQGIFAPEQRPGQRTAEMVTQFGIQTLIACQPDQFGYETGDLRLGLFTAALLEGLRIHRLDTLGELALYVGDRVPQLCDHHWKPLQIPFGIGSPGFQLYPYPLPAVAPAPAGVSPIFIPLKGSPNGEVGAELMTATRGVSAPARTPASGTATDGATIADPLAQPLTQSFPESPALFPLSPTTIPGDRGWETRTPDGSFVPRFQYTPSPSRSRGLWRTLKWTVLILLLPLGGLLGLGLWQRLNLGNLNLGILPRWGGSALPTGATDHQLSVDPQLLYAPASSLNAANTNATAAELLKKNQQILREARSLVRANQASLFSDAIAEVRKIQPGEPLYDQAQLDIDRWSEVIFDFALGRAQMGDYTTAIAAAQLVPADRPVATEAQKAVLYWQQQLATHPHHVSRLEQAAAIITPTSASSYSDAIALLHTIPANDPDYEEAQHLIEDWSLRILKVAQTRARQGQFSQAIEAARLVPLNSQAANQAQQFIETWKKQP